ncbi:MULTISPECIES: hypothetical protein [unclassified Pseudomonas]|uniref:hypothetical protein n=1 Tax=unclassified Pseudomonas TaxID=196821 RepID=UPI0021C73A75|nr:MULTISPECIES: hypothetical protein [unclassified Pseudomonas]MCU1733850.1 hypothetical protein [Pseudomonas sp. 20P_3.2_Bac4]MCU1747420.1 hypothetical protein [Pseudomonas sp. 20P_3.2_Bac5]
MSRIRSTFARLFAYPSRNQALFAIAAWPVMYALGCWQTPQIAEFLKSLGLEVSMWQVFQAGFGAYTLLLIHHRKFNRRHFERNAADIDRYQRLKVLKQRLATTGLAGTGMHAMVLHEMSALSKRLGYLVEADDFYRKLRNLNGVFRRVHSELKQR